MRLMSHLILLSLVVCCCGGCGEVVNGASMFGGARQAWDENKALRQQTESRRATEQREQAQFEMRMILRSAEFAGGFGPPGTEAYERAFDTFGTVCGLTPETVSRWLPLLDSPEAVQAFRRAVQAFRPPEADSVAEGSATVEDDAAYSGLTDRAGGLQPNAYGPGVHRNRYGQAVTLWPDGGGVPGEQLQIKQNAYGPGVHMDQYGRAVREQPWP